MEDRVQLLGIEVSVAPTKRAIEDTISCIENENSQVVYLANSETLLLLQEHDNLKKIIENCSIVLPGNASMNATVDQVLKYKRDPFFFESYYEAILDYAIEMGMEILLVAQDEEKFTFVQENIHTKRPYLNLSGVYAEEAEGSLDHIVNAINSIAPDILLVALEEQKQLELLDAYRNQMNAGLMMFTGNILYNKVLEEAEVPESIQRLRIENLYKWFQKADGFRILRNNLKMRFRMKKGGKKISANEEQADND